jgi:hypothetical protein
LYDEVGDLMVYLRSLKGEVRKLNSNFRSFVSATEQYKTQGANADSSVVPQISREEAERILMQQKLNAVANL